MSEPARLPAPLYRGSANAWECDEGGHLNVRFQFERALVGLGHFAHALGMPRAFTPAAGATLVVQEAHIRFLKEARPGDGLTMHGGVVEMGESEATLCLDMRHDDGAPASAFTLKIAHADTRGFAPFPWTRRTRAAAQAFQCALPAHAAPRSVDVNTTPCDATLQTAEALGASRIGASMIAPSDCDAFGRLRGEHVLGRVSDSVPHLLRAFRQRLAGDGVTPAGAVVEARVVFRHWPRAGDLIDIYSTITEVGEKTMRPVHWLCDPETGVAWASLETVNLTFNAVTRKTITPSPEARADMAQRIVKLAI